MNCIKYESKLLRDCGCDQLGILVLFGFSVAPLFSVYVFYMYKRREEKYWVMIPWYIAEKADL